MTRRRIKERRPTRRVYEVKGRKQRPRVRPRKCGKKGEKNRREERKEAMM